MDRPIFLSTITTARLPFTLSRSASSQRTKALTGYFNDIDDQTSG